MVYGFTDCFWGLRVKLISWYSILIFSDFDPEIKMYAWSSTIGHLTGEHSQCLDHEPTSFVWQIGVDNPEAAVKLQEILDKRVNDFKESIIKGTTNINESFHKEQLIYHDKTVNFPISQEIRDKLAVLRHNEGLLFELNLRKRLKLPDLEEDNYFHITNMDNIGKQASLFRRTTVYRNQDRLYRKKVSDSHKKEKPGDYKRDTDSE